MSISNKRYRTPSETRLQRLQDMYHETLKQHSQKPNVTPRPSATLRSTVSYDPKSSIDDVTAARIKWSRTMGNAFSSKNITATLSKTAIHTPARMPTTPNSPMYRQTSKLSLGRNYGNMQSERNAYLLRQQSAESHADVVKTSKDREYSKYFTWKQRLTQLERQRDDIIRLYGKNSYMDEYADLLERCWRFEGAHPTVQKFATNKIGSVLSEFQKMKKPSPVVIKKSSTPIKAKKSDTKQTYVPEVVVKPKDSQNSSSTENQQSSSQLMSSTTIADEQSKLTLTPVESLKNVIAYKTGSQITPSISVTTKFGNNAPTTVTNSATNPSPKASLKSSPRPPVEVSQQRIANKPLNNRVTFNSTPSSQESHNIGKVASSSAAPLTVDSDEIMAQAAASMDKDASALVSHTSLSTLSTRSLVNDNINLDLKQATSILSAIVNRDDVNSQFVVGKKNDNHFNVEIVGDQAIKLANELLSSIVTKCVERIIASSEHDVLGCSYQNNKEVLDSNNKKPIESNEGGKKALMECNGN